MESLSPTTRETWTEAMNIMADSVHADVADQPIADAAFRERAEAVFESIDVGVPAADDHEGQVRAADEEASWLAKSVTWCVATDVVELVSHAAHDMPPEPVMPSDLPSPSGFVWLETPFWHGEAPTDEDPQSARQPVSALHWHPTGRHDVEVICYRGRDETATFETPMTTEDRAVLPILWPSSQFSWDYGRPSHTGRDDSQSHVARFLKAMWTISAQTIAAVEQPKIDRAARRRAERAQLIAEVRVVTLRRIEPSTPTGQAASQAHWSHRWIVRGIGETNGFRQSRHTASSGFQSTSRVRATSRSFSSPGSLTSSDERRAKFVTTSSAGPDPGDPGQSTDGFLRRVRKRRAEVHQRECIRTNPGHKLWVVQFSSLVRCPNGASRPAVLTPAVASFVAGVMSEQGSEDVSQLNPVHPPLVADVDGLEETLIELPPDGAGGLPVLSGA
jgi:hypothetical protein